MLCLSASALRKTVHTLRKSYHGNGKGSDDENAQVHSTNDVASDDVTG